MVRTAWDLDDLQARYRAFVTAHARDLDGSAFAGGDLSPHDAFVRYMGALDDWRALPTRDPGLPRELLRSDWAGDEAMRLLERIVETLDEPAFEFVTQALHA